MDNNEHVHLERLIKQMTDLIIVYEAYAGIKKGCVYVLTPNGCTIAHNDDIIFDNTP